MADEYEMAGEELAARSHVEAALRGDIERVQGWMRELVALRAALREAEDTRRIQDDALLKVSKAWREQRGRAEALVAGIEQILAESPVSVATGQWFPIRLRRLLDESRALAGEPRAEGRR